MPELNISPDFNLSDLEQIQLLLNKTTNQQDLLSQWTFYVIYKRLNSFFFGIKNNLIRDPKYTQDDWQAVIDKYSAYHTDLINNSMTTIRQAKNIETVLEQTKNQHTLQDYLTYVGVRQFVESAYDVLNNTYHQKIFNTLSQQDKDFYYWAKDTLEKYT